jgi:predicted DCC family thiol-disulfide oxidoreductase YuxK
MTNEQTDSRATLYYDGRCPLCMKEMARLDQLKSEELQLADIHELEDPSLPDKDTLLRNLHLRTTNGEILIGVDANVAAWDFTPHGRWFQWLRWPLLRPVTDRVYRYWAEWRYRRIYGRSCTMGGKA